MPAPEAPLGAGPRRLRGLALIGAALIVAAAATADAAATSIARPGGAAGRSKSSPTGGVLAVDEVAPGVFVHRGRDLPLDAPGHDDIANLGFVIGTRCVAVIDTGGSVRVGEALRAAVRARTRLPICQIINTHVHVDHVLGNAAFAADRAQFWGHAALVGAMRRNRDFFLRQYGADLAVSGGTAPRESMARPEAGAAAAATVPGAARSDPTGPAARVIAPDHTVSDTASIDLGGRTLSLRAWPRAHTDCDLTVQDSATQALFTGDLLFRERLPALDGSLRGWLVVLDELSHLHAAAVVPGHGAVTRDLPAALAPERRYLSALAADLRDDIHRGVGMTGAASSAAASERPRWLLWNEVHPGNVIRAYEELEWE